MTAHTFAAGTLFQLDALGLLAVKGPDAETFLQGQLTADAKTLAIGATSLSAHCNAKGRMQSNFHLYRAASDVFLLQLPKSMLAHAQASLQKYAVFSKVEISVLSCELRAIACNGPDAELADKALHSISNFTCENNAFDNITYWLPQEADLKAAAEKDDNDWYIEMIDAGIAYVLPDAVGEHIPQMYNMDLVGGISFTKGCYTGQEIIARMKYLGSVKRRLYAFFQILPNDAELSPISVGTAINNSEHKKVGEVAFSAIDKADTSRLGLAVLSTKDSAENLWIDGQAVSLNALPYALDNES